MRTTVAASCPVLGRIERLWPNLRRSAQRQLCMDADLCRSDRNDKDLYSLTSKSRLSPAGELNRIRTAWPTIPEDKRRELGRQAEAQYSC